jgi:hypothetical protein
MFQCHCVAFHGGVELSKRALSSGGMYVNGISTLSFWWLFLSSPLFSLLSPQMSSQVCQNLKIFCHFFLSNLVLNILISICSKYFLN